MNDSRRGSEDTAVKDAIPETWIQGYVDQWLVVARKLKSGPMYASALMRADYAMDLVTAWRESKRRDVDGGKVE